MTDQIHVTVSSWGRDRPLALRYTDPITGQRVAKSAGTGNRREAERAAAVLEDDLNSGRMPAPLRIGRLARFRRREINDWIATGRPRTDGRAAP